MGRGAARGLPLASVLAHQKLSVRRGLLERSGLAPGQIKPLLAPLRRLEAALSSGCSHSRAILLESFPLPGSSFPLKTGTVSARRGASTRQRGETEALRRAVPHFRSLS